MTEPLSVLADAIAPGSSREQRAAAADVCRMLIAALEAQEGQPLPLSTAEAQPGELLPTVAPAESAGPATDERHPTAEAPSATMPDVRQPAAEVPPAEPLPVPDSQSRRTVPMPAAVPLRPPAFPIDPQAVASLIDAARTLPTETMLDLAISHVRSLVQAKGQPMPQASAPVRFHLVPLPPRGGQR